MIRRMRSRLTAVTLGSTESNNNFKVMQRVRNESKKLGGQRGDRFAAHDLSPTKMRV